MHCRVGAGEVLPCSQPDGTIKFHDFIRMFLELSGTSSASMRLHLTKTDCFVQCHVMQALQHDVSLSSGPFWSGTPVWYTCRCQQGPAEHGNGTREINGRDQGPFEKLAGSCSGKDPCSWGLPATSVPQRRPGLHVQPGRSSSSPR